MLVNIVSNYSLPNDLLQHFKSCDKYPRKGGTFYGIEFKFNFI